MQNYLHEQLCQEHQDRIVAVAFNDQNGLSQGLCLKCWPQSCNKKVVLVEDLLDMTKNIKEEYQQMDTETRKNIRTLYQLIQELEKLKAFMKQQINESIKNVNDWIRYVSDQDQCARTSLSVLNIDLNASLQNAQQQVQELQKEKEKFLQFIQQKLKELKDNDHFNSCNQLLTDIDKEKLDPPQIQSPESLVDKSMITQKNLFCQQHNNQGIIMVDLNKKPKIPKRLACVYCIQYNPTSYTAIQIAEKQYRKQEAQKIENLKKHSKISSKMLLVLYPKKKRRLNQKAETHLNNLNVDWETLKYDEVSEFAEKLSYNGHEDFSKSQIYLDFLKINQEVNKKINDAFTEIQCIQNSGETQIKQLMNKDSLNSHEAQTDLNSKHNQKKENIQINKTQKIAQVKDANSNKQKNQPENTPTNTDQNIEGKSKKKNRSKEQNSNQDAQKRKISTINQKQSEIEKPISKVQKNQKRTDIEKVFSFLLNDRSIKQEDPCRSFAFNSNCSYLIAACDKSIKLFSFNTEHLIFLQSLNDHPSMIVCCTFLKGQNRFISGCLDGSMLIWSNCKENGSVWECEQTLNGHTDYLGHIIHGKVENMIISCSNDKTIRFWKKSQNWELKQILEGHNEYICSISLNESENKLISGAYDDQILISEPKGQDKKWTVIQLIKVEWGRRLCFITDTLFTFQPCKKQLMHVYEQKDSTIGFIKSREIRVESKGDECFWLFPQQFSKKTGILINKNCHLVNIIRWRRKKKFYTDQVIFFGTKEIYGSMTDDGEWLVTWDDKSKEIQLRHLEIKLQVQDL
ncbi:unnamed protein product (macronuclear) [Paramecium tetraurelia]|uniref:Uncharacterized protein n=1 Tax=Paramecium tetraurelia TaxID=5888 RepID=A0BLZ9_PARTE|nr:uncharacterized protein GSPATT00030200001 [Paramecium tetraurelia]CAK59566.1 unnamed protein product [Paramecium tetraurelia]|eukprot:XP_001426964.1 hypothetical protein (macronuclear) [Paramecium tetraurelia strain d4-2]